MSDGHPMDLGAMPAGRSMTVVDERVVHAPLARIAELAINVERWPAVLDHYRYVRFTERRTDGGGVVEMSADRPFGPLGWPTWWTSRMSVSRPVGAPPVVRYTHVVGITTGMDVEWTFEPRGDSTFVRIVHVWNGPPIPVLGPLVAGLIIGPVFVSGIASRTLAGLALEAERSSV